MIEKAYADLGHNLRWRFLCAPARNLAPSTPVALITANPGGKLVPEDHPRASCESGSAYIVERWGSSPPGRHKLQVQLQELFKALALAASGTADHGLDLLNSSLLAYFIPFRSPRLSQLLEPQKSLTFAVRLWTELLEHADPQLIITIDRGTYKEIRTILGQKLGGARCETIELPTGWGRYTATLVRFHARDEVVTLLRLPHLSTFQLFTSPKSRKLTAGIIAESVTSLTRPLF